jgi:hypothetical protein
MARNVNKGVYIEKSVPFSISKHFKIAL